MSKTTTLRVHHAFLYISLPSLHNNDLNDQFWVYLGTGTAKLPSLFELGCGSFSLSPTQNLFFQLTGPLGIVAKESEKMRSQFFSDIVLDVAVVCP